LRGAKKIPSLVIASPAGEKQSHKKVDIAALRSQRRIGALPTVARNDKCKYALRNDTGMIAFVLDK